MSPLHNHHPESPPDEAACFALTLRWVCSVNLNVRAIVLVGSKTEHLGLREG